MVLKMHAAYDPRRTKAFQINLVDAFIVTIDDPSLCPRKKKTCTCRIYHTCLINVLCDDVYVCVVRLPYDVCVVRCVIN